MNNFFKNINSDCLIHISMYFDKEELKKINLIDTYLKSFFEENSNIIFYKVIKNKYDFFEFKNIFLFKKSTSAISVNKNKSIKNKIDIIKHFDII